MGNIHLEQFSCTRRCSATGNIYEAIFSYCKHDSSNIHNVLFCIFRRMMNQINFSSCVRNIHLTVHPIHFFSLTLSHSVLDESTYFVDPPVLFLFYLLNKRPISSFWLSVIRFLTSLDPSVLFLSTFWTNTSFSPNYKISIYAKTDINS